MIQLKSVSEFKKNVKEGTILKRTYSYIGLPNEEVKVVRVYTNHIDFFGTVKDGTKKNSCFYYNDKLMGKMVISDTGNINLIDKKGEVFSSFEVISY